MNTKGEKMLTREEAQAVLYEIINSGILSNILEENLREIANLIAVEKRGLHFWGGDADDYSEMVVCRREDLWIDEVIANSERIEREHTFTPALYECMKRKKLKKK